MKPLKLLLSYAIILISVQAVAQSVTLNGTVSDADTGEPIPFASIVIKGTERGVSASADGIFSINARQGDILVISFVGYGNAEEAVGRKTSLDIRLKISSNSLDDAVVVAYGVAKRESLTGSIASIGAKDLERRTSTNVMSSLEGATPGVQFTATSGDPGSSPGVRIRGFSTINGDNTPLYVIDGVPLQGSISEINPSDVENISILKDAASSALYGNRAANGVIMITTKRGQSEKVRIRVDVKQGVSKRSIPEYEILGVDDWMETYWTSLRNQFLSDPVLSPHYPTIESANAAATSSLWTKIGRNVYNVPQDQVFTSRGKINPQAKVKSLVAEDLDWYAPLQRTGYRQEYDVSGDVAGKRYNLFISAGYLKEDGYVRTTDYERFTSRMNGELKPADWIKLSVNMSGGHRNSNSLTSNGNPFSAVRSRPPYATVYAHNLDTPDGDYYLDANGDKEYDYTQYQTRGWQTGRNAIMESFLDKEMTVTDYLDDRGSVEVDLPFDFSVKADGQLYVRNSEGRDYTNAVTNANKGTLSLDKNRYVIMTSSQQLTWKKEYDRHSLDLLLGHESHSEMGKMMSTEKKEQTFENNYNLNNFAVIVSSDDYENNYRTEGYIARLRYNYSNRYYFETSYRRDGSSRFYKDNRWGNFFSAGGSWSLFRESWMKNVDRYVSGLKLRASYGEVGNDQSVGKYAYLSKFNPIVYGGSSAYIKGANESLSLVWESSNSFGAAIEGRIMKKVDFTIEYFDKMSKDLLFDVSLPLSVGVTSATTSNPTQTLNIGDISNRGLEVSLDADLIQSRDWNMNVGANATFLKNKIIRLPEENREAGILDGNKKYVEGRSVYDFWLYQWAGVDQMTGRSLYKINFDKYVGSGELSADDDRTRIPAAYLVEINGKEYTTFDTYAEKNWSGSSIPKVYGSISASLGYKNLTLSALMTYAAGGKVYDSVYQGLMIPELAAMHKDIKNAWNGIPLGMTSDSPDRIDPDGVPENNLYWKSMTEGSSTRFLLDGSYMSLKYVSLSYSVPKSFAHRISLSDLAIGLNIENIFTLSHKKGLNPQYSFGGSTSNNMEMARIATFSFDLTF